MSERGRPERSRWSALGKVEKAIAVTGAILGLPRGGEGPPEPTPTATAVERAQAVRACERLHGMTRAQDKRATRAERHGSAFDAKATRFRSCAWPPPPGAEPEDRGWERWWGGG